MHAIGMQGRLLLSKFPIQTEAGMESWHPKARRHCIVATPLAQDCRMLLRVCSTNVRHAAVSRLGSVAMQLMLLCSHSPSLQVRTVPAQPAYGQRGLVDVRV